MNQKLKLINLIVSVLILPSIFAAGWYRGDLHQHTGYSSLWGYDNNPLTTGDNCVLETTNWDGGVTISDLRNDAILEGLYSDKYWFSITDHSYCLDSSEWSTINSDASTYTDSYFLFMPSEELSVAEDCATSSDESFCPGTGSAGHLGAHGISSLITSDEEWCPELPTSQDAIDDINVNGVSIINHPEATHWDWESMSCTSSETGVEIWNEKWDEYDDDAVDVWKEELLDGNVVYAYGGSDSHDSVDTTVYNYAYLDSFSIANLETALSSGKSTVSNNGLIYIEAKGEYDDDWTLQGSTLDVCDDDTIQINANYDISHNCELTIYKEDSGTFMCAEDIKL